MTLPTQEALTFTGPPLAGSDGLTEILNKMKSLVAHRSGASRPADIQDNELWCDTTTATAQALKIYDGAQDITIGTFNSTTHTWTVAGALLLSLFTAANDFIIASGSGTAVKKTLAEIKTLLAGTSAGDLMAYDASVMKTGIVAARTRAHSFTPSAVTAAGGGALDIDCDLHEECTITLAETTTTVGAASNQVAGKYVLIIITGTTGKALAWNTNWHKDGVACTIAAPANGVTDMHCFRSNGTYMKHIGSKLAV